MGLTFLPHWGIIKMKIAQTVIELPEFISQAKKIMTNQSKDDFIEYIAHNPLAGDVIQGTGGARKVRWASIEHKGKSGGSRVIYYYHNTHVPIFLFTVFRKSEQENITQSDRNQLKKVIQQLIARYE